MARTQARKAGIQRVKSAQSWKPIKSQSISSRIVDQVLEALFRGEIKPGEFFGAESDFVNVFGASRLPVREALGRLQAMGVVRIKTGAGGGVWIAEGDPDHFANALAIQFKLIGVTPKEIFDARLAIQPMAAELAAVNATPDDLTHLEWLLDETEAHKYDTERASDLLANFHLALVEASKSRPLVTMMHALLHAPRDIYPEPPPVQGLERGLKSLRPILQKIREHDGEAAFQLFRSHIQRQRDTVLKRLAKQNAKAEKKEKASIAS